MSSTLDERFPIGRFIAPNEITPTYIFDSIDSIESFPATLTGISTALSEEELSFKYREHGWCIREIIHHCADSHLNAFIRFRKSLTEKYPPITGYKEAEWVKLADSTEPIQFSLDILKGLHHRWAKMLQATPIENLTMSGYYHPEQDRVIRLSEAVSQYAWHGNHHLAHIKIALERKLI